MAGTERPEPGDALRRVVRAWERVVIALRHVVAHLPGGRGAVEAFAASTTELEDAAGELAAAARGVRPEEAEEWPAGALRHVAAAVAAIDTDLPPAGTPRSEWTDQQVLLAAAYRLADLTDALENQPHAVSPAEIAAALNLAHEVLDASGT